MKKFSVAALVLFMNLSVKTFARQDVAHVGKYGNTFNPHPGIRHHGYVGHPMPWLHTEYEPGVARNCMLPIHI